MDHRDDRVRAVNDRAHGGRGHLGILPGLRLISAYAWKLADIGTGGKGLFAGAAQHHATHAGVSGQLGHDVTQVLPHGQGQGVHFSRVAEGDDGNGVLPFDKDGGLHDCSAVVSWAEDAVAS
ncbi:hypothetical protein D3C87_1652520 [compost metagenome]